MLRCGVLLVVARAPVGVLAVSDRKWCVSCKQAETSRNAHTLCCCCTERCCCCFCCWLQVRGLPALQYFGNVVWKDDVFDKINSGRLRFLTRLTQHLAAFHITVHSACIVQRCCISSCCHVAAVQDHRAGPATATSHCRQLLYLLCS
jgi:hypothetical protein